MQVHLSETLDQALTEPSAEPVLIQMSISVKGLCLGAPAH
jgi:hypothetical protein